MELVSMWLPIPSQRFLTDNENSVCLVLLLKSCQKNEKTSKYNQSGESLEPRWPENAKENKKQKSNFSSNSSVSFKENFEAFATSWKTKFHFSSFSIVFMFFNICLVFRYTIFFFLSCFLLSFLFGLSSSIHSF